LRTIVIRTDGESIMPELVAIIQTTWPKIRMGLYRREDGCFQFVEEGIHTDEQGSDFWLRYTESTPYSDVDSARRAMIEYYCYCAEDEYEVDPGSVTVLDAPDFEGPFHPVLTRKHP
jgi:hypothetical protein